MASIAIAVTSAPRLSGQVAAVASRSSRASNSCPDPPDVHQDATRDASRSRSRPWQWRQREARLRLIPVPPYLESGAATPRQRLSEHQGTGEFSRKRTASSTRNSAPVRSGTVESSTNDVPPVSSRALRLAPSSWASAARGPTDMATTRPPRLVVTFDGTFEGNWTLPAILTSTREGAPSDVRSLVRSFARTLSRSGARDLPFRSQADRGPLLSCYVCCEAARPLHPWEAGCPRERY